MLKTEYSDKNIIHNFEKVDVIQNGGDNYDVFLSLSLNESDKTDGINISINEKWNLDIVADNLTKIKIHMYELKADFVHKKNVSNLVYPL